MTTADTLPPTVIATTPRLLLREFLPTDDVALYHLNADPDVLRYTGDDPFADYADAHAFVLAYRASAYATLGFGRWAVLRRADDTFLGWCGLGQREPGGDVDIGFRLRRDAWGQGYATEAAYACLNVAFTQLQLERVIARAEADNSASLRVIAKLGLISDTLHPRTDEGMLRFILTREQWQATQDDTTPG